MKRSFRERDPLRLGIAGVKVGKVLGVGLEDDHVKVVCAGHLTGDLAVLVSNGSLLLQEINDRSAAIRSLLSGTVSLAGQITGTIEENRATLNPALVQLHKVVQILTRNQNNLDHAVKTLGPFVNAATDGTGTGRWFDGYLQSLIPLPVGIAPPSGPASTVPSDDTLPILH